MPCPLDARVPVNAADIREGSQPRLPLETAPRGRNQGVPLTRTGTGRRECSRAFGAGDVCATAQQPLCAGSRCGQVGETAHSLVPEAQTANGAVSQNRPWGGARARGKRTASGLSPQRKAFPPAPVVDCRVGG